MMEKYHIYFNLDILEDPEVSIELLRKTFNEKTMKIEGIFFDDSKMKEYALVDIVKGTPVSFLRYIADNGLWVEEILKVS